MKLYKDEDLDQILEIAKDNDIAEKNIFDCFLKQKSPFNKPKSIYGKIAKKLEVGIP
jgi:hypothetical protein